jgi:hypothetical protein
MSHLKSDADLLRQIHKEKHPDCTWGNEPHYVGKTFDTIGFYLCDVPEDIRNHTRCMWPYDHEHPMHPEISCL